MDREEARSPADEAFERFVVPELEVLVRVARSLTYRTVDADDLVQDTLLRAYRSIHRFDGRHPRAWLLTIMRNAHLNGVRVAQPSLVPDPGSMLLDRLDVHDSAEAVVVDATLDPSLERAIARLPHPLRQVLELVDIQGLTYRETARVLSIRAGTVMSRLHRARRRVRAAVATT